MSKPKMQFQVFKSGHFGDDEQNEQMLPTGVQANEENDEPYHNDEGGSYMLPHPQHDPVNQQDIPTLTKNRPVADEDEALFPIGVNPKDEDN